MEDALQRGLGGRDAGSAGAAPEEQNGESPPGRRPGGGPACLPSSVSPQAVRCAATCIFNCWPPILGQVAQSERLASQSCHQRRTPQRMPTTHELLVHTQKAECLCFDSTSNSRLLPKLVARLIPVRPLCAGPSKEPRAAGDGRARHAA